MVYFACTLKDLRDITNKLIERFGENFPICGEYKNSKGEIFADNLVALTGVLVDNQCRFHESEDFVNGILIS